MAASFRYTQIKYLYFFIQSMNGLLPNVIKATFILEVSIVIFRRWFTWPNSSEYNQKTVDVIFIAMNVFRCFRIFTVILLKFLQMRKKVEGFPIIFIPLSVSD